LGLQVLPCLERGEALLCHGEEHAHADAPHEVQNEGEIQMNAWKRRKRMNGWTNLCPWVWYTYDFYHISEGLNRKEWKELYEEKVIHG
jgi:hypothetical protein